MSVVCGIDFSECSANAAEVAAGIAARLNVPLYLVHALGDSPIEIYVDETTSILTATRRALDELALRLRHHGAEIHLRGELAPPKEALLRVAQVESATLLVFGAAGRRRAGGEPVGSTADRLAQRSHVPALVIRSAEPFRQWLALEKPLRVLVGLDFNLISDEAWIWAQELSRVAPVDVIGAHIYSAASEFQRLGQRDVQPVLRRELELRFRAMPGADVQFRLEPGIIGPFADDLLSVATEVRPDLIVVGSHERNAIARLWERSVSRSILRDAQSSVACVPLSMSKAPRRGPEPRAVLAATDFSRVGNAALEFAYRQVGAGGKVYLIHVLPPADSRPPVQRNDIFAVSASLQAAKKSAEEELRSLIPLRSIIYDRFTEVLILESADPAQAIAQAAERLGADMICLGTHGRSGIGKAVLGSVAQAVLSKTRKPVLLVRAPKE
jgi:nucleotide-binding universal stress UspA family protein